MVPTPSDFVRRRCAWIGVGRGDGDFVSSVLEQIQRLYSPRKWLQVLEEPWLVEVLVDSVPDWDVVVDVPTGVMLLRHRSVVVSVVMLHPLLHQVCCDAVEIADDA